jgi:membrane protein implicated in regulation of membrane protease activity
VGFVPAPLRFPAQTKGVRGVTTIDINMAAWISAVAAAGSSIVGTAILWPVMKRVLAKYDAQQVSLPTKDGDVDAVGDVSRVMADVEEDAFQKAIEKRMAPVEVDPEDKSMRAYFYRFR